MHRERQNAYKLIAIQCLMIGLVSIGLLFNSFRSAYSLFLGGVCYVLPNIYFAYNFFKNMGARNAKKMIRAFYIGEVVKFLMIGVLSILVFKLFTINLLLFFIGFIVTQVAFWIAPQCLNLCPKKVVGGKA
jgi:ATP synthase protein I